LGLNNPANVAAVNSTNVLAKLYKIIQQQQQHGMGERLQMGMSDYTRLDSYPLFLHFFLAYLFPYLPFRLRIDPLRFQAGCRKKLYIAPKSELEWRAGFFPIFPYCVLMLIVILY